MQLTRSSSRLIAACTAVALLGGGCTPGLQLAGSDDVDGGRGVDSATTTGPAPVTSGVPPPAPDPASVPGAEQLGIVASDGFCDAAPKVASGFTGLFDSAYAAQGPNLQAQLESALVGVDVLRSVAPEAARADLDESRSFLAQFRDVLAGSGWNLETAAASHRDFFAGPEPDAGFAAMTSVVETITTTCGITP